MLSVLPLLFLLAMVRWVPSRAREAGLGFDLRDALLIGAVATALWGALGAEVLSAFHQFARGPVIAWWTVGIVGVVILARLRSVDPVSLDFRPDRGRVNLALIAVAGVMLLGTGVLAVVTPPSTPDCLCYHLPRQLFWIDNRTVAFYPTGDLRQLEMPPLAEYLGAQLMLLSGNDYQANLIQWSAYLLTALGASAIARDLGAGPTGQTFAALLVVLNPAAASQSVNPKNDIVAGLWLIALIWSVTRSWQTRTFRPWHAIFMGASLGLLLLTKGTGFIVAPAVCAVIGLSALRTRQSRAIALGLGIVVFAVALNTPHWFRNKQMHGSPLGLGAERGGLKYGNEILTPAAFVSNLIRNITLHTNTPSQSFNAWQEKQVKSAHKRLGIDPADPRTTPHWVPTFTVMPMWANDGNNPAPVHLLLGVAMIAWLRPRRLTSRPAWPVLLIPYACVFFFTLLLKWQPCHVRLEIPIVAAAAPVLAAWLHRRTVIIVLATLPAAFLAVCAVLWNDGKPILGPHSILGKSREEIMFVIQIQKGDLANATAAVEQAAALAPGSIGFDIQAHTYDYSVMRMFLDRVQSAPRLRAFRTFHGPPQSPEPMDVVITSQPTAGPLVLHAPSRTQFRRVFAAGTFGVYVPAARLEPTKLSRPVPEFSGWGEESGLKPPEGPYPEFKLPVVRWAEKRLTTLNFESDGEPMALVMECRRNDTTTQTMTVRLNGTEVHRYEFGDAWLFLPFRVPLEPVKGPNVLTFEFANINEPGSAWAVQFRRLQIVPASWIAEPSRPTP